MTVAVEVPTAMHEVALRQRTDSSWSSSEPRFGVDTTCQAVPFQASETVRVGVPVNDALP